MHRSPDAQDSFRQADGEAVLGSVILLGVAVTGSCLMEPTRRQFVSAATILAAGGTSKLEALPSESPQPTWIKSKKNPVLGLGPGNAFDSQNIMSPAIAKDGGQYFLFYAGGPAGPRTKEDYVRYQLGLAISKDGERWIKRSEPLLELGKRDNFHCTPALLRTPRGELHKRDGRWHMVYCGNRADDVEYATSGDGLTWEKDRGNPIFRNAYAPNLLQVGNEIWMYYVHKPGSRNGKARPWEIHLARGCDFNSLTADKSIQCSL